MPVAGRKSCDDNRASCDGGNAAAEVGVAPAPVRIVCEPGHHGDEPFRRAVTRGVPGQRLRFGDMPPADGSARRDMAAVVACIREPQRANRIRQGDDDESAHAGRAALRYPPRRGGAAWSRHMNRRAFLACSAAAILLPAAARAAPAVRLKAGPVTAHILPEGEGTTPMLGFNGSTPGPELRARRGERLSVSFENATGRRSAVHWHGIHLDNAMDGVPELTQAAVEPGASFDYAFEVPHAGTYWYHAHHRSWEQVARGLYGPLIVEEPDPPAVDRDIAVVLDDWRLERSGALHESFGNRHDFSHGGRMGNFARALFPQGAMRRGDRIRLRLINAATARMFPVRIAGGDGRVVAHDGMPLAEPAPLGDLLLAPAQRTDVILDVAGPVSFALRTRRGFHDLGTIPVGGSNPAPGAAPVAPLPAPDIPMPDRKGGTRHTLVMQGGAMGGRHGGSDFWAFNDRSGLPAEPWRRFARGETARIALRNETAFPHGIHLHGHHFHEIGQDGALGHYRDTTLVGRRQSRDILCVFDNPGKWLLHCHTLGHQASGMKTWVEVA